MVILGAMALYLVGILVAYLMMFNGPTFTFMLPSHAPRLAIFLADFRMTVGAYLNAIFVAIVLRYYFGVSESYYVEVLATVIAMCILFEICMTIGEYPLVPILGWVLAPIVTWLAVHQGWQIGA